MFVALCSCIRVVAAKERFGSGVCDGYKGRLLLLTQFLRSDIKRRCHMKPVTLQPQRVDFVGGQRNFRKF